MKSIYVPKLADILPDSILQDEKFFELAEALSVELKNLSADIKQTIHLPRLEELDGTILDLLAWQLHIDFYEPYELADDVKRNLIRNSVEWHKMLGTPAALELVNQAFKRDVKISEWFKYGGEPYHFKIETAPFYSLPELNSWLRQLLYVKNVRSWATLVIHNYGKHNPIIGMAQLQQGKIFIMPPLHTKDEQFLNVGLAQFHSGKTTIYPPRPLHDEYFHNVGLAQLHSGRTILYQPTPTDCTWQFRHVGLAQLYSGRTILYPQQPTDNDLPLRAALVQFHSGRVTIRKPPDTNINNDLGAAFLAIHNGAIKIPSRGVYVEDDEFIKVIEPDRIIIIKRKTKPDEYLPNGDVIILYFKFPRRNRSLLFHNPRDNLTREEIKAVGDFVAEKKILTNIHQEYPSGICRVDIIKTHTTILF